MAVIHVPPAGGGAIAETILGAAATSISVTIPYAGTWRAVLSGVAVAAEFVTCTLGGDAPAQRIGWLMDSDGVSWTAQGANGPGVVSIQGMASEFHIMVHTGADRVIRWTSTGDVGAGVKRGYFGSCTWTQTGLGTGVFTITGSASNLAAGHRLALFRS